MINYHPIFSVPSITKDPHLLHLDDAICGTAGAVMALVQVLSPPSEASRLKTHDIFASSMGTMLKITIYYSYSYHITSII